MVRLRIGRLSGVVPDALSYAFEVMRQGTMAADAELHIESIPATCWCAACEKEFEAEDLIYECPGCGELSGELRRGTEMELASLEISEYVSGLWMWTTGTHPD